MKRNPHIGSDFDDFLQEEGILDAAQAVAIKRVVAYQLERGMKAKRLTKAAMAKRMGTTRAQVDRLLDPESFCHLGDPDQGRKRGGKAREDLARGCLRQGRLISMASWPLDRGGMRSNDGTARRQPLSR